MAQVKYFARKASKTSGTEIDEYDLLDLIFEDPERATAMLEEVEHIHSGDESRDAFAPEGEN